MKKRSQSIQALMDRCDKDLRKLEADYDAALQQQTISTDLKIDIKNICGNLRSVLDYLATDIRETFCPSANPKDRYYFPVFKTPTDFAPQTNRWYPGLQSSRPDVWRCLESFQPYQPGMDWLGHLNQINNENKHGDLVEQTRVESPRVTVTGPGSGIVSWDPGAVHYGSGVYISGVPVDPRTQLPVPHPSQKVEKVVWVDFRFRDPGVSVLHLLRKSVTGIRKIASDLGKLL